METTEHLLVNFKSPSSINLDQNSNPSRSNKWRFWNSKNMLALFAFYVTGMLLVILVLVSNVLRNGYDCKQLQNYVYLHNQTDIQIKPSAAMNNRISEETKITWVKATNNAVPDGSLLAGYELPHYHTYIIRSQHGNNTVVGKVFKNTAWFPAGHYTFGGAAFHIADYEVLVASPTAVRWEIVLGSNIPKGAVIAGVSGGEPVYVGRMAMDKQLIPGRVLKSVGNCFVEYESHIEHSSSMYEVLVDDSLI